MGCPHCGREGCSGDCDEDKSMYERHEDEKSPEGTYNRQLEDMYEEEAEERRRWENDNLGIPNDD